MTKEQYETRLDRLLDRVFERSDDRGWRCGDLASASGLADSTVRRINVRRTRLPRLKTVLLMAEAVGLVVELAEAAREKGRAA